MKTDKWNTKMTNDYYDSQPGIDVTEAGMTGETLPTIDAADPRTVYWTGNIWLCASLVAYGIPLLGYAYNPRFGHEEWVLDNHDGKAAELARAYRIPREMICPVHDLQKAYRTAAQVRSEALGRNPYRGQGRSGNNPAA